MASSWINIDKLGAAGMEPDLMHPHREPNSLDSGMNVRAIGPNLGNAGGYLAITGGAMPIDANTLFLTKSFSDRFLLLTSQDAITSSTVRPGPTSPATRLTTVLMPGGLAGGSLVL